MLEFVGNRLSLPEVLEAVEGRLCFAGGVGRVGCDTLRAALYARGCREWTLFAGSTRSDIIGVNLFVGGCGG